MKATIFLAALMFVSVGLARATGAVIVNEKGTAGADIVVDNTAGGVTVADAKTVRCGGTIRNTGAAAMRCGPASMTVTTTAGTLLNAGDAAPYGSEFVEAWKCIRTTGASTTANVQEAFCR